MQYISGEARKPSIFVSSTCYDLKQIRQDIREFIEADLGYEAILSEGNMIKPYLKYKEEASGETWIENAFSKENVEEIMQGVEGVVNDPEGTGYAAHRDDILLAGKTGTAELKATKEDTSGKEIGWFSVFTADKSVDKPILLISMVENVKGIGGSGYVVKKDATILDEYFEE